MDNQKDFEIRNALLQIIEDYEDLHLGVVTQASINRAKRALGLPLSYPKPCPICGRADSNHMLDVKHRGG